MDKYGAGLVCVPSFKGHIFSSYYILWLFSTAFECVPLNFTIAIIRRVTLTQACLQSYVVMWGRGTRLKDLSCALHSGEYDETLKFDMINYPVVQINKGNCNISCWNKLQIPGLMPI